MYAGENLLYNVRNDFTQNSPTMHDKQHHTRLQAQDYLKMSVRLPSSLYYSYKQDRHKNMGKWYETETGQYPRQ